MPQQPQPQSPYKSNSVRSYPPQPALNQTAPLSHSSDTSVPLLTLYLRTAEEHDGRRRKLLKGDTDQILVFCGLFSATVAALVPPSISDSSSSSSTPDLVPFFLQNVVILLQRIYSGLSNPSSIPINPLPLQPPPFQPSSPPASLVVANSYWLLSLLLSISCALVALSLQRWAEPPTEINSSRGSLPEQARLRTLFAAGIERLNLTFLVEVLHCLMHIAFSIFLVGLLLYLFSVDFAIFLLAAAVTVLSFMAYAWLTVIPIIRPGSPYYTPFTNILAVTYAGVLYGTPRLLYLIKSLIHANMVTQGAVRYPEGRFRDWYLSSMKFKMAQELAPLLDSDVLKRTLDMLRSDDDLEQFFEAIPGFFASEIVQNPQGSLALLSQPLAEALVQFWNRTLTSDRSLNLSKDDG